MTLDNASATQDSAPSDERNPLKRPRPRPVISCLECRRKKLKCDRTLPCRQCVKAGRSDVCAFQPGQLPEPRDSSYDDPTPKRSRNDQTRPLAVNGDDASPSEQDNATVTIPHDGLGMFEKLQFRVAHLETLLDVDHTVGTVQRNLADRGGVRRDRPEASQVALPQPAISRHRLPTTVFPDAAFFMRGFAAQNSEDPRIQRVADDLRCLHYSLKQFHKRPHIGSNCVGFMNLLPLIPSRDVCYLLSELYFDNLEHCFRILHKTTFNRQLNEFFLAGETIQDLSFIPQLMAVLSMGALLGTRSECVDVAQANEGRLIPMSIVYIQDYLDSLSSKKLYTIPILQTKMLLLILRWMRLDKNNDLWRLSGDILRHALIMNMDRDPSQLQEPTSPLQAELRRRLWMTIVEEDLMLSILRNMPCMVPDFTCQAPLNVDDDELQDFGKPPSPRPQDEWSDSLCQVVLAQSVKDRLHACQDLRSTHSIRYEHVLDHTRSFEKILETLPAPLRFSHQDNIASKAPSRLMARMELDISIRRPLMHLYSPFAHANNERDEFSEARAGYLQSCLMLDVYQDLFDPKYSELGVERPDGYWDFFYNLYRSELHQAVSGICLELKRISTSSQPDTPIPTSGLLKTQTYSRASLIHAIKDTLEPMVRRIGHLGADLKELSYLTIVFNSVKSAQYDPGTVVEALEDLVAACKLQLCRNNIPIIQDQNNAATDTSGWTPGPGNDIAWTDLANFPFEFDYGNEMSFDLS
ncbi:uncharacterized protein HMPREF1541_08216 [Cyphellophora europaea CBS 101466]|uniref:Zn(2)-C6 fungal-type domain-containing protein n=1 Tax=Cyphellophora europaea (strain CBS 101466) TaxID=1220924 RepID=W2RL51_CYPE1|nr:uncharacterized protein HMPREF1541_08216 [Cyphellophora europaea CBS 101466]ETN37226.1 hypothetical protein HMPREF1541_08216 [Cyphellophora europaea CBS 101466]